MTRPRVVIDTNVYISGLLFAGNPADVLTAAVDGVSFTLLFSDAIRDEVTEKLKDKFEWTDYDLRELCAPLWEAAEHIRPRPRWSSSLPIPTTIGFWSAPSKAAPTSSSPAITTS